MSEKLCLNWNDFQDNVKSAFGNLRDDQDSADVTLACDDGKLNQSHKQRAHRKNLEDIQYKS